MDFKIRKSDLYFQTQTNRENLRNEFLESLSMSKSPQPPRGKTTALNHSMRQEGLHILVTHSQNQEPAGSLSKSLIDVTRTSFTSPAPSHRMISRQTPARLSKFQVSPWARVHPCLTHPSPLLSGPESRGAQGGASRIPQSLTPATLMTTFNACLTPGIAQKSYI